MKKILFLSLFFSTIFASPLTIINPASGSLNLKEVFMASPIIYSTLFLLSFASFVIFLLTLLTFKQKDLLSQKTIKNLKSFLEKKDYENAKNYCENTKDLLSSIVFSGISAKNHGAQHIMETIKSEGKRITSHFWHRISLLNEIVIIAPMLGLLGTVLGMFYAFYDINKSIDSLSALFDGLGIAVGTTVAGLIVAIIAMVFYSILKYRIVKILSLVENEATILANMIKE